MRNNINENFFFLFMKLIEEAFTELFPEKEFSYNSRIRYSRAFKGYNANVKFYRSKNELIFSLSKNWNTVSRDIKRGLLQELMLKIFKSQGSRKKRTLSMDLYQIYLKNTHIVAEKNNINPKLQESFLRVNEKYFNSMIDQVNLVWGVFSLRTLGKYDYGTDTITISRIFENAPERFVDRVMHHEMLHKKHKYNSKNGRCHHHTREFRDDEKLFENFEVVEEEINHYIINFRKSPTPKKNFVQRIFGLD